MQNVEVTSVTKLEGSRKREGIHPGEDSIKEVTGNVEALVAPPQLHHVTAGAAEHKKAFRFQTGAPHPAVHYYANMWHI